MECYRDGFLAGAFITMFENIGADSFHPCKELDVSLSHQGLHANLRVPEELFVSIPDTSGDSILKVLWVGTYGF
jgi:hypothetical protein